MNDQTTFDSLRTLDDQLQKAIDVRDYANALTFAIQLIDAAPCSRIRQMYVRVADDLQGQVHTVKWWGWLGVKRKVGRVDALR